MPKTISLRLDQSKMQIITYVWLTFFGYLCIGLPLDILPIFIHKNLGYSEIVAGIIISLQYIATFLVRGLAGKMVDTKGPKLAVLISMSSFLVSGILLFVAFQFEEARMISLILLAITRLIAGCA